MAVGAGTCGCPFGRPGGLELTERALRFCGFDKGAKLADVGCGRGDTVNFIKNLVGCEVAGVDNDPCVLPDSDDFIKSEASSMPFANGARDGLLYECSLSKMDNPACVLREAARVIKRSGYLIISDFYARGEAARFDGILGRADKKETITAMITDAGFTMKLFEDRTSDMKILWAQLVLDNGMEKLFEMTGSDSEKLARARCGYALFIAVRR